MTDEYTPTTEEVREAYLDRKDFEDAVSFIERRGDEVAAAEFDRWLNTVRAEAWDEGYDAAPMGGRPRQENPYRKETPDG